MTRVALVVGGGGMIGGAVARRLAHDGTVVVSADLTFRDPTTSGIELHEIDLSEPANPEKLVSKVVTERGRLDYLVLAAGTTSVGALSDISLMEWDRVHAINLRSVFLLMQAAASRMREARFGRIVSIGSVVAKNGGNPRPWLDSREQTNAANAAYAASKAGVHALTFYLAKELAGVGVTVNCVAPGPIATPMTRHLPQALIDRIPMGRMGSAEEVASAVAWLCGEEAGFVTGEILDVNGGLWMD